MNTLINQLLAFGLYHDLIGPEDTSYAANRLLDLFGLDAFTWQPASCPSLYPVLEALMNQAVAQGLCANTATARDLFDTRIMDCIMPRPGEVIRRFRQDYAISPQRATDNYYALSIHSNYIRKSRTDRNIRFAANSRYGQMQITINLSKPEKDPKEIAAARSRPSSGYPKCLLCRENVGFAGHENHPARQTHRIIPLQLATGTYYLQYSPYVYYNEHCIVLNEHHEPMRVDRGTFDNLFAFITQFPHYMLGSNTDIPIVGGSILSHDHYQGGRHRFPIQDARVLETYTLDGIQAEMIDWPLSTLRLRAADPDRLADLCTRILEAWKQYEDEALDIIPYTGQTRHNAITPIARRSGADYEIDLVFRNNRTSEAYPDGIFHPHPENHHIKKENIGLIEVMGLAVLPARLQEELGLVKQVLAGTLDIDADPRLEKHREWIAQLQTQVSADTDLDAFMDQALADKFVRVLEDAGVFKTDEAGRNGFRRWIQRLEETL